MSTTHEPNLSRPGFWPLRSALQAHNVRMNDRAFETACERGDIPVRIERLGPAGKRFVRVEELAAWLRPKPPAHDDPFTR